MADWTLITSIPEIKSAVMGDLNGGFLDAVNEPEGETVAAVMGFVSSTVFGAGESLGLGPLRRVSLTSATKAVVLLVHGTSVISAAVEPARALGEVEKRLDAILQAGG
jgi:predicted regulator of Ras-like GTPase activity (Roadblock/LC7/MglB family)